MPPKGGFNEASLKGWDLRAELPLAKVVDPSVYIKMKFVGSTPYSEWTHKIKLFLDFENPLSSSKFTLRSTARLPLKPHLFNEASLKPPLGGTTCPQSHQAVGGKRQRAATLRSHWALATTTLPHPLVFLPTPAAAKLPMGV